MPLDRIGYNINANSFNANELLYYCQAGGAAHLIMNNPGVAQQCHDASGAIIISRGDYPDDSATWPEKLVNEVWPERAQTCPDIYHYWPNEPHPKDLKAFLDEGADFMRRCDRKGLKFCLGNFSTEATINASDVKQGVWDKFIAAACDCAVDGKGFIGVHEYMSVVLPFGADGLNPANMYTTPLSGPWPDYEDIVKRASVDWHLFRATPLLLRAEELGYAHAFDIMVTECFWDRVGDLEEDGDLDRADALAGQKVSGLPATRKALQAMFPQHGDLGAALAMLEWCEDTYPDHYKGFCLFTLNRDEQWSAYDLSTWKEFHEGLRAG